MIGIRNKTKINLRRGQKYSFSLSAGFEPAQEDPNGFLVHRLNHSATTTFTEVNRLVRSDWANRHSLQKVII